MPRAKVIICARCEHYFIADRDWYLCPKCDEAVKAEIAKEKETRTGDLPQHMDRVERIPFGGRKMRVRPATWEEKRGTVSVPTA